jgi:opacity protein-like surface antigen
MRRRVTVLAAVCVLFPAANARADWLLTPFIGTTFAVDTTFLTPDPRAPSNKQWMFGGSGAWLSDQVFGVEADLGLSPGFFEADNAENLVTSSHVTTLSANVLAAAPLAVTRDSLRPYLLAGLGLVHVTLQDQICLAGCPSSNLLGLQLGGGALGFISDRTGLRFDLRYVRTLSRATDEITRERRSKLSFWRATVGVTLRY